MTDKPKTLHEQLTELAEWLDEEGGMWGADGLHVIAAEFSAKAAEVRTMAERVKGRCVYPVAVLPEIAPGLKRTGRYVADTLWIKARGSGDTPEEAVAHLQSVLDEED